MGLSKLSSLAIAPIRMFFVKTNKITFFRNTGIALYKLGLFAVLQILKFMPGIKSVYASTHFDKNFIPGRSDIDLFVIIKNMPVEREFKFLRTNWFFYVMLRNSFPFMKNISYISENEFVWWQANYKNILEKTGKHTDEWTLLQGKELRNFGQVKFKPWRAMPRTAYEEIIVNIFESCFYGNKDFRRTYKFTLDLFTSDFVYETGKIPKEKSYELISYLLRRGISKEFLDYLFELPKKEFACSINFAVDALYYGCMLAKNIKEDLPKSDNVTVEGKKEFRPNNAINEEIMNALKKIEKKNISSIQLSSVEPENELFYLYILLNDNLTKEQFHETFLSAIEGIRNLKQFEKEIKLKLNCRMGQDFKVFPLIVPEFMLESNYFMNKLYPLEKFYLMNSSVTLYGKPLKPSLSSKIMKEFIRSAIYYQNNVISIPRITNEFPKMFRNFRKDKKIDVFVKYLLLREKNVMYLDRLTKNYLKNHEDVIPALKTNRDYYIFLRKMLKEDMKE